MNRSALFVAVVMTLAISLLVFSPPLAAQEKPAGASGEKIRSAEGKLRTPTDNNRTESSGGPTIFFPEPLHDFGTIARGSKVSHNFKVINKGNEPLRLIKAKGS